MLKVGFLAVAVGDFGAWVDSGRAILSGQMYLGVYTGPAYIEAAAYSLWLLATNDRTVPDRISLLFSSGEKVVGPLFSPEMFAFTLTMRLPVLIADLGILLLIMHIVRVSTTSRPRALSAGLLWASSPLVFLFEGAHLAEALPALMILLGVYTIYKSRIKVGSAFLTVGSILRLAPLFFAWVYMLAFFRARQFRNMFTFLAVQLLFAFPVVYFFRSGLFQLLGERPGILIPEVLGAIEPSIMSNLHFYSYGIPLTGVVYVVLAYYLTKPSTWKARAFGAEALVIFCAYAALSNFYIAFLLWMIPTFLVFAVTTRFGSRKFIVWSMLGLLFYIFNESKSLSQSGYTVFLVPNMNAAMASVSADLSLLQNLPLLPIVFRSLFSASLLLAIFWIMRETLHRRNSIDNSCI